MLGRPNSVFYTPEDRAAGTPARLALSATRTGRCRSEGLRVRKDGRAFIADVVLTAMRDGAGKLIGSAEITRDITEQRRFDGELKALLARVKDDAEEMQAVLAAQSDVVLFYDTNSRVQRVNPAFALLYGFDPIGMRVQEIIERTSCRYLDGRPLVLSEQPTPRALRGETVSGQFFSVRRADGGEAILETASTPMYIDGRIRGTVTVWHDITALKRSEARLQLSASVFSHAREGIAITDAQGDIVDVNDTFVQITGYPREEVIGKNPRILKSGRQGPEFYDAMWSCLKQNGHWDGEIWNRRKSGEVYAELLSISVVRSPAGDTQNYVALFSDITSIKEHEQQLERMAHYDALTGLPNRVLLADRLQQAILQAQRRATSVAVVYLDLDGFKNVNDQFGHEIGDQFLVEVAQRMKAALREGDTLARIGGDEFVAILIDLEHPDACESVLSRLLETASTPTQIVGLPFRLTASMGVTLFPMDHSDADQLLRHADQAMYLAKQSGKNRYHVFDVAQEAAIRSHREHLEEIGKALSRREFMLYYQPKVNMRTGEVIGAEALIRWQHPERGLLLPAELLPAIANHPLIVEIGEWVIQSALAQVRQWRSQSLRLPVSVNIAARQLQQPDFLARLTALLGEQPSPDRVRLEIEILESDALADVKRMATLIQACRRIGVRFSIDDFGTGYSSLTYLKHLPAETVKIDQSFVRDMLGNTDDQALFEGIIKLAKVFGRQVLAEGVETIAHGNLLLSLGCELAQGYGIARPMPAAEIPAWTARWRPDRSWTHQQQIVDYSV